MDDIDNAIDFKTLARGISLIENQAEGFESLLLRQSRSPAKIIGITGAPGTGKSSLTDALIGEVVGAGKKVAVICVDPSSPFNRGALLGDRIRMSTWYNHPNVFIRSLASKGSLGGLHPRIFEIADFVKNAGFDFVIIETVGVGQSEVDIVALADVTVVVLVPEGGDVVQTLKAGLMEVADLFVINKADRPGAASLHNSVIQALSPMYSSRERTVDVLKTVAIEKKGTRELFDKLQEFVLPPRAVRRVNILTEKVWALIQQEKMKHLDKEQIKKEIAEAATDPGFNPYLFAKKYADGED